ncbi:MAG: hypothetical protein HZB26_21965 [Candidatus Hydrogenedentes bacterium]|nr:hypothetical protein [Candidatus Hydrogenedentota bacterium]
MAVLSVLFMLTTTPVTPELWPVPKTLEVSNDRGFTISERTPMIVSDDATPGEIDSFQALWDAVGAKLTVVKASDANPSETAIFIGEPDRHASFENRKLKRAILDLSAPGPQGFRLLVSRSAIVVSGTDPAGTFYGLQILTQLAKQNRVIPALRARDEPSLPVRGALYQGRPSSGDLRRLAEVTCNMLILSSDDFGALSDGAAAEWKAVFDEARRLHIEPVPMIRLLDGAQPIVQARPSSAEGMTTVDHIVLDGNALRPLSKSNVIDVDSSSISVKVSGKDCRRDTDFAIVPGINDPSVGMENPPWTIRRITGGAIPDGATVDVTYTCVPSGAAALCPAAPETFDALRVCFAALNKDLKPRYVHIGMDAVQALNRDLRCAKAGYRDVEAFGALVTVADKAAKKVDSALRLILWADALNPRQGSVTGSLAKALPLLPKDVILTARDPATGTGGVKDTVAWCKTAGRSFFGAPGENAVSAYTWIRELAAEESPNGGIVYSGDTGPDGQNTLKLALGKAWSESALLLAWPEGLNDYFGASLWEPKPEDTISALADRLNHEVLRGVLPKDEFARFEEFLKSFRERVPEGDLDTDIVERLYRNLTEYVTLEAAYSEKPTDSRLRQLVRLVETQAKQDPNSDPDRTQEIISRAKDNGLFVPSSILFGPYLLPSRQMTIPPGHIALELPGTPEFRDTEHHTEATYDFIASPGPICRVDFETVDTTTLSLERSDDARAFVPVEKWTSEERGGLRAPVLPSKPFRTRGLRISVDSPNGQAILRNPCVFALKEPTAVVCAASSSTPVLDASFKENAWPPVAQVDGFVRTDRAIFAEAQTTVRLVRTRDTLFIGVYSREPRMDTMSASLKEHDDPVWKEESCAILIDTGATEPFCFAVTPLGAQYESRGSNASWDGAWQAATKNYTVGWAAEIAIPFATLGATPQKGTTWNMNFIRTRYNVKKEESAWARREEGTGDPALFGKVTF